MVKVSALFRALALSASVFAEVLGNNLQRRALTTTSTSDSASCCPGLPKWAYSEWCQTTSAIINQINTNFQNPGTLKKGVIIPLYIYPAWWVSPGAWDWVYNAAVNYPGITFTVIVNPNSGPGTSAVPNSDYQHEIRRINALSNIVLLGYVDTAFGSRAAADVSNDVSIYAGWSKVSGIGLDGIYFDNQASGTNYLSMYKQYAAQTRANSGFAQGIVGFGPGQVCDPGFVDLADFLVIFEQPSNILESDIFGWYESFIVGLSYTQMQKLSFMLSSADATTMQAVTNLQASFNSAYLYITDSTAQWGAQFQVAPSSSVLTQYLDAINNPLSSPGVANIGGQGNGNMVCPAASSSTSSVSPTQSSVSPTSTITSPISNVMATTSASKASSTQMTTSTSTTVIQSTSTTSALTSSFPGGIHVNDAASSTSSTSTSLTTSTSAALQTSTSILASTTSSITTTSTAVLTSLSISIALTSSTTASATSFTTSKPVTSSLSSSSSVTTSASTTTSTIVTTSSTLSTSSLLAAALTSSTLVLPTSTSSTISSTSKATTSAQTSTIPVTTTTKTTSSSVSLCPNGSPTPTQCSGQNQFNVKVADKTVPSTAARWLNWSGSAGAVVGLVAAQSSATAFYFEPSIGRLRTCPCVGVPFYQIEGGDVLSTDGFFMSASNGILANSNITAKDASTGAVAYWVQFPSLSTIGLSSSYGSTGHGDVLDFSIIPITV